MKKKRDSLRDDIARGLREPSDAKSSPTSGEARSLAQAYRRRGKNQPSSATPPPEEKNQEPFERLDVEVRFRLPGWGDVLAMWRRFFQALRHRGKLKKQAMPDELVIFLQVLQEQPKFYHWFMILVHCSSHERTQHIQRMLRSLRGDAEGQDLRLALRLLENPHCFEMVHNAMEHLHGAQKTRSHRPGQSCLEAVRQ